MRTSTTNWWILCLVVGLIHWLLGQSLSKLMKCQDKYIYIYIGRYRYEGKACVEDNLTRTNTPMITWPSARRPRRCPSTARASAPSAKSSRMCPCRFPGNGMTVRRQDVWATHVVTSRCMSNTCGYIQMNDPSTKMYKQPMWLHPDVRVLLTTTSRCMSNPISLTASRSTCV